MVDSVSSQVQQVVAFWQKMAGEQVTRLEAYGHELGKVREQALAHTRLVTDESSKLAAAWLDYGAQLGRDCQTLAFDGIKQGLDLFQPKS